MNKNTILYLCDGEIPTCGKDECYKRGRECRHTTNVTHALNPEPRNLVPDEQGNLWETEKRKVGGGFSGVLRNVKL